MGEKDLLGLVYCIYRTIHEPERWSLVLREVQRLLRSDACDLSVYDFEARQGEIVLHTGCYDQELLQRYGQYFAPLNPWLQRRDCYRPDGSICFGRQIVPHARLVETEFYNEWLRPQGLFHRLSATIASEQHRVVYISLLRGSGTGSFQHEDQKPLQRLAPHLRQALELYSLTIAGDPYQEGKHNLLAGQYGLAAERFMTGYRRDPYNVDVLKALGVTYDYIGRPDLARRHFERALAIDPASPLTLNNLGRCWMNDGQWRTAVRYLERAWALDGFHEQIAGNLNAARMAAAAVPTGLDPRARPRAVPDMRLDPDTRVQVRRTRFHEHRS